MKELSLPKELVELPYPWCITNAIQRHKLIKALSYNPEEKNKALDALERCLSALSQLMSPSFDSVPESLGQYWDFSAQWLAESMPILDKFQVSTVEQCLKEYGMRSSSPELYSSPELVDNVAAYWLWWVISDIAEGVLRWLEDETRDINNAGQIDTLLEIAANYWEKIDPNLASSLVSCSAVVGWSKALPLLNSVEHNSSDVSYVRETAQDYRAWILSSL